MRPDVRPVRRIWHVLFCILLQQMNMEPIMQHVKDFAVDLILQERFYLAGLHAEVKEISIADSKEHLVRPAYAVLDNFILRIIDVYEMPKWKQSLEEYIAEWKEETHE